MRALAGLIAACTLAGCAARPSTPPTSSPAEAQAAPPAAAPDDGWTEAFPGVRVSLARRAVEFEGIVPIDCHYPETPDVYLEVIVCTPDTREHEALVMTRTLPSHVHAALLLVGLNAGEPGRFVPDDEGRLIRVTPRGDAVRVLLITGDDQTPVPASDWVVNVKTGRTLSDETAGGWVFAGSRIVERQGRERYDADGTGTLVGLHTFGAEVLAWRAVYNPESVIDEPEWIASRSLVPEFGTPVRVRIEAAD